MYQQYQDFIEVLLNEASNIALRYFGKTKSTVKAEDNNQVLTEADLMIGKALLKLIEEKYPSYNVIDEEAGVIDKKSDYTWVIDPIDGTSNFANGLPLFGSIVGLLYKNKSVAGGIALPYFEKKIIATKQNGAYSNGTKISVSKEDKLSNSLIAYGIDGHPEKPEITTRDCALLAEIVLNIRNLRISNSVFDIAMVAEGKYGACLNQTSKIWDNVGSQIIIEEAGGIYTDYFGKPIDYSNSLGRIKDNFTFCLGAVQLHSSLQDIIHRYVYE